MGMMEAGLLDFSMPDVRQDVIAKGTKVPMDRSLGDSDVDFAGVGQMAFELEFNQDYDDDKFFYLT